MSAALGYLEAALLHGTVVAGLIWVVERLLRPHVSPAVSSALWTVALLKFLVPFAPVPSLAAPPVRVVLGELLVTGSGSVTRAAPTSVPWLFWAVAVYGLVVGGLAARHGLARWKLSRQLRALPEAGEELVRAVGEAARLLGLTSVPAVRVGAGPLVFGLWRPTLVLPRTEGLPPRALLVHELAHLRRRDPWVLALQAVAQVVFFFWPPVRWVNRQIAHFRELACDDLAIEHGAVSPTAYARLLLEAQRSALSQRYALATLEMSSRTSRLERRIDMLLKLTRRPSPRWAVLSVVCGATLALTGAAAASDGGITSAEASDGGIDPAAVEKVATAHAGEVAACFEQHRKWDPTLSGTLVYDFEIKPDGTVGGACLGEGTSFSPDITPEALDSLTLCIGRAVKTWKFPATRGGSANVSWPFKFVQQAPPLRSPVTR